MKREIKTLLTKSQAEEIARELEESGYTASIEELEIIERGWVVNLEGGSRIIATR